MTAQQYLDRRAAAEYLSARGVNVKPETLARWKSAGRHGLALIKIGRLVRYDVRDLDGFIDAHRITPGSPRASAASPRKTGSPRRRKPRRARQRRA